jgi:beta-lactamase superfamily II metal-dependent hydrolase
VLNDDRAHSAALLAFERRVRRVIVGGGWPASSLPVQKCRDSSFRWDDVEFQLFAAGRAGRFCVLRVATDSRAILLAGDLDVAAERSLIARLPSRALATDVATMPRQASSVASSAEWIEASTANLAIATGGIARAISRDTTLERWRRSGAVVLDTRRDGAIQVGLGTDGVTVIRADSARYPFVWRRVR